jgi:hypothetical protein
MRAPRTLESGGGNTIVGNLVEDPEFRFTNAGIAVANLGGVRSLV